MPALKPAVAFKITGNTLNAAEVNALKTAADNHADLLDAAGTALAGISPRTVYLSRAGCVSDADLGLASITYGTDNTAAAQAVFGLATDTAPIEIIVDGRFSITGLKYRSNTTVRCLAGCGFILRPGADAALLGNYNESFDAITTRNVSIDGGIWNCNSYPGSGGAFHQTHSSAAKGFTVGLRFYGVENVRLTNMVLFKPRTYSVHFYRTENVYIENFRIDIGPTNAVNMDGIHINGPAKNIVVRNLRANTFDDCLAFNADECFVQITSYYLSKYGPIQNVLVDGVVLENSCFGVRILSGGSRVDNVVIRNVSGRTRGYWLVLDNYLQNPTAAEISLAGPGNVGTVTLENIDVDCYNAALGYIGTESSAMIAADIEQLIIRNYTRNGFESDGLPSLYLKGPHTLKLLRIDGYQSLESGALPARSTPHFVNDGYVIDTVQLVNVHTDRGHPANPSPLFLNKTGTVNRLQLSNVNSNAALNVVEVQGGLVNYISASGLVHDRTGSTTEGTFKSGPLVKEIVLSNYYGPARLSGAGFPAATVKNGDGFTSTLSVPATGPPATAATAADTLTSRPAAASLGTADTGQVWQLISGSLGRDAGGALVAGSASAENIAVLDSGNPQAVQTLTFGGSLTSGAVTQIGMVYGLLDANNYYVSDNTKLYTFASGVYTTIINYTTPFGLGDTMEISRTAAGAFTVKRNGAVVGTATNTVIVGGSKGGPRLANNAPAPTGLRALNYTAV